MVTNTDVFVSNKAVTSGDVLSSQWFVHSLY